MATQYLETMLTPVDTYKTDDEVYCYYHPDVATSLSCANCGRPICPKDLIETPVGAKCKECGTPSKKMRGAAKPAQYAMAVLYATAAAVLGGLILREIRAFIRFGGVLLVFAVGVFVGEAVRKAVRRRSDMPFQILAGGGGVAALAIAGYFGDVITVGSRGPGLYITPTSAVYCLVAVVAAVSRVRN